MPEPFGFLVVDKPQGMTSHDVVNTIRHKTGVKRVGHAGTLDPMATGVLVICVGAATRLSEYVMGSDKLYFATVRLGVETNTYDADGQITSTVDASHITQADIEQALARFEGEIEQMPPMYSAIKQGGKKLYELARQGKEVERAARRIRIGRIDLVRFTPPDAEIAVGCSAGTYIRSIGHDLGAALGVGAHLIALRRAMSGTLRDPLMWDELLAAIADGTWQKYLTNERIALPWMDEYLLSASQVQEILNGRAIRRVLPVPGDPGDDPIRRAYTPDHRFIAILTADGDRWQPHKVFLP